MQFGASTYLGASAYLGEGAAVSETANGWYGLMSIMQAARDESHQPHREDAECPHDGTLLQPGPHGVLYCPFDGYRPGGRTT